jgi:hypothetical protein
VVIGFRRHGVRPAYADIPEADPELLERARVTLEAAGLGNIVTV